MICILTRYGIKKAMHRDGELIGWKMYRSGVFGALSFIGYNWI